LASAATAAASPPTETKTVVSPKPAPPAATVSEEKVEEADPIFKNKEEREKHAESVRNEGIAAVKASRAQKANNTEIDLEIEAPGSANKVAEEGAKTI
jgi:hypothetical protein